VVIAVPPCYDKAMTVEQIATEIKQKQISHKPVLIAVEGFGGASKSTVAQQLKKALGNTYVIGIDDFIVKERLLETSADEVLFDRKRLEQQILMQVHNGQPTTYQRLEWVDNKLSEPIEVPTTDYLIIEGISTTHPDIEEYFDYKVWVNTPIEVAKQRGRLRDAGNENEVHWDLWAKNDLAYQAKYHPELKADFVIDNGKDKS